MGTAQILYNGEAKVTYELISSVNDISNLIYSNNAVQLGYQLHVYAYQLHGLFGFQAHLI